MIFTDKSQHNILRLNCRPISIWAYLMGSIITGIGLITAFYTVDLVAWCHRLGAPLWFAQHPWVLALIVLWLFILSPLWLWISYFGTTIIELNKHKQKVIVTYKAKMKKGYSLSFSAIEKAAYSFEWASGGSSRTKVYTETFVLKEGEPKLINSGLGRPEAVKLCQLINNYLGIETNEK